MFQMSSAKFLSFITDKCFLISIDSISKYLARNKDHIGMRQNTKKQDLIAKAFIIKIHYKNCAYGTHYI